MKTWLQEVWADVPVYFGQLAFVAVVGAVGAAKLLALGVVAIAGKLLAVMSRRRGARSGPGPGADVPA